MESHFIFFFSHAGNSESGESETDGSLSSSYIPTSFSMTTSASLTLRDPATGTRYVQTQLLQVRNIAFNFVSIEEIICIGDKEYYIRPWTEAFVK